MNFQPVTKALLKKLKDEYITSYYNRIKDLIDAGFKVEFCEETYQGKANNGDLSLNFTLGGENFYFTLESYTQNDLAPALDKMLELKRILD